MRTLAMLLLLIATGAVAAESKQVTAVVNAVINGAKSKNADYRTIESVFPKTLVARDYEAITRQLMLDKLDLEDIGDKGVTYKSSAIHHAMHTLGSIQDGAKSIIRLWEDEELLWDGARSLELCDAAVRRGKEMMPLLSKVSKNQEDAKRCMEHIVNGHKTAF